MPWLRLRVTTPRNRADDAEDRLRGAGAIAVTLRPAESAATTVLEPGPGATLLWDSVRVEALLPVDCDLGTLRGLGAESDFVADQDWSDTWRKDHRPLRFGRLLVLPKDDHARPRSEVVTIRLDPGLAFGTGTHPSTAMCLDWLARTPLIDKQVLDVGSGSGILAIAAARLGAAGVVAVDHDAQARQATRDNARTNTVGLTVLDDLAAVQGKFDVAIANIVSNTLCEIANVLTRRARTLVLSGVLPDQVNEVVAAYPGVSFDSPEISDGWAMLVGVRHEL